MLKCIQVMIKTQTVLASENRTMKRLQRNKVLIVRKKTSIKSTSFEYYYDSFGSRICYSRYNERLAEFKRDKASKEGRVLLENIGVTTASAVTSTEVNEKLIMP